MGTKAARVVETICWGADASRRLAQTLMAEEEFWSEDMLAIKSSMPASLLGEV